MKKNSFIVAAAIIFCLSFTTNNEPGPVMEMVVYHIKPEEAANKDMILNSVNNAVIFDLEKKLLVEDLSGYSVNSIIESYFDSDDYSTIVKEKVIEYERLLTADILNEEEEEKLFDLKEYFEDLPKMFSPELALKINQIQLANLAVK